MNTIPSTSVETDAQVSDTARGSAPQRKSRLALAVVGALAIVAAGAVALTRQSHANGQPGPARNDTPRLEGDRIVIPAEFSKRAELVFEPVASAPFEPTIAAVGAVDFDPEHVAAVGTRLRGLVSRVAKFEGDVVEKGTLLAVIESPELGEAQASVKLLAAEKNAAEINSRRESDLLARNLSTAREAELARVELAKYDALLGAAQHKVSALAGGPGSAHSSRFGTQELRAPLAGTVVERHVAPGQSVDGELVAFKIANLDRLWVELQVYEQDLGKVRVGDHVELTALAAENVKIKGRVSRIGPKVDTETRSATLRVEVDNRERHLRAGQAVNAVIHASGQNAAAATLVPNEAVTYVDGKPTAFIAETPTKIRIAKLDVGASNGKFLVVRHGIKPGEQVVTHGAFALKSELFR